MRPRSSRRFAASLVRSLASLVALLMATDARADRTADAEDLFRRAKALMSEKKLAEACPLFGESYRLDPGMGTLLNLALCDEQLGKVASAWGEFRAVEQQARAAVPPNESRAQLAREHADKLLPRLSRVRIAVAPEARVPGLVVKIDGEEKAEPLWGGVAVDPGTRVIEASAPYKTPIAIRLKVDDEGLLQSVSIPALADAPIAVASQDTGAKLADVEAYAANRARRTTGFLVGGLGLATLVTGAVLGVAAVVSNSDAKDCSPCLRGTSAAADSDKATDRALAYANVANITVPLGLVGAGLGAYLVLTARPSKKVGFVPVTSRNYAGLSLGGDW